MTRTEIQDRIRGYQESCVLLAAAELHIFGALAEGPLDAEAIARRIDADPRATAILLDALAATGVLAKADGRYAASEDVLTALGGSGPASLLQVARHQANCLRRWAQLAKSAKEGRPAERVPSVRGTAADLESFIGAMDELSNPVADPLMRELADALPGTHLLDVGGASGTWTIAFLRARPEARATIFDLPEVIPLARRKLESARVLDRVRLVPGDFARAALPGGADLAWVSAIVHQNSREENRRLFSSVRSALSRGGHLALRDIVMEADRTSPAGGALFAVNMLVATASGGTFTFEELREDLEAAGFEAVRLLRRDTWMNSIVTARRS